MNPNNPNNSKYSNPCEFKNKIGNLNKLEKCAIGIELESGSQHSLSHLSRPSISEAEVLCAATLLL